MDTQSNDGQAGNTPRVLTSPRVALKPTIPLSAAGTRPLPAVSVPRANGTTPAATATALPELLPPLMWSSESTQWHAPYGERVPTRPVANWSMFVLPMGTAPTATSWSTTRALRGAGSVSSGQPTVVGVPATSMLSLTANGRPRRGESVVVVGPWTASPARSSMTWMNAGFLRDRAAAADVWTSQEGLWEAIIGSGLARRRGRG